jgi:hypothetical protein
MLTADDVNDQHARDAMVHDWSSLFLSSKVRAEDRVLTSAMNERRYRIFRKSTPKLSFLYTLPKLTRFEVLYLARLRYIKQVLKQKEINGQ